MTLSQVNYRYNDSRFTNQTTTPERIRSQKEEKKTDCKKG